MTGGDLQFGILGPLEARRHGKPIDLGTPKQRSVLAVLLLSANRVVSVDRLADALWGAEAAGTASLQVYVSNLRRAFEPESPARARTDVLLTQPPGYVLRVEPRAVDAMRFEALAAQGHRQLEAGDAAWARACLAEALALWRGPALAEYAFEAFAEREAARLEELRVVALEARFECDIALGAHAVAAAELEALVAERPLRERLWALLMLSLYRCGRQADALRAYTRARQVLIEELGIEPGTELRSVQAGILAQTPSLDWWPVQQGQSSTAREGPPASSWRPGETSDLVGREEEVERLGTALAQAVGGRGRVLLVSGEPGIGKTRLSEELAARAVGRGALVVWGRCDEGEGAPPFWPWVQIIEALYDAEPEQLTSALAAGGPELGLVVPRLQEAIGQPPAFPPTDTATARFRLGIAIATVLTALARHRPLVLILDDLHWADRVSLELTSFVAERVQSNPVLITATYRDVDPLPGHDLTETLGRLARLRGVVRFPLGGLAQSAVGDLLMQASGSEPSEEVTASIWARTEGNPFFVGELVKLLTSEGTLGGAHGEEQAPPGVGAVLRRRLARLPEATNALLSVSAVSGRSFELAVVAAAAGIDDASALDLVDLAVACGLIVEEASAVGRFRFAHALVQETIYTQIGALRRARLHAQVGQSLERIQGDRAAPSEVANHYVLATSACGPEKAIAALARAADAAQAALAPEAAEDHFRLALALLEELPAGRDRDRTELDLQDRLATLLAWTKGIGAPETGRAAARARELCLDADDRRRMLRSRWGAFSYAIAQSDFRKADALGKDILDLGTASSDAALIVAGGLAVGGVAMFEGRLAQARSHLRHAKEAATCAPDLGSAVGMFTDLQATVDGYLGMVLWLQGEVREGRELQTRAVERARQLDDPPSIALALLFDVLVTVLAREDEEARSRCQQLIEHAEKHRLVDFVTPASLIWEWSSRFEPAPVSDTAEVRATPPPQSYRPFRPLYHALAAEVHAQRERLPEAIRCLDLAFTEAQSTGEVFYLSELHRLHADLLTSRGSGRTTDEASSLRRAVTVAEGQGAAVFRARAEKALGRIPPGTPDHPNRSPLV